MSAMAHRGHTRQSSLTTDSWVTPQWLLERVGPFDLDPCAANPQPWPTATRMINEEEDGLLCKWSGFVWCNPPYGKNLGVWLNRMALHNNGIALVFARTDTMAFHRDVFPFASALLFLRGRLVFSTPEGEPPAFTSGGPSVLIAYGWDARERLSKCRDIGALCVTD